MLEVAKDFVAEAAENMKRIMEGQPTWNGVKLVVDFKRGAAWGSMEKYEIGKKAA
jgi:DNA polymerase I-like protein with 3'-5' exonuclease and polymerase domains